MQTNILLLLNNLRWQNLIDVNLGSSSWKATDQNDFDLGLRSFAIYKSFEHQKINGPGVTWKLHGFDRRFERVEITHEFD